MNAQGPAWHQRPWVRGALGGGIAGAVMTALLWIWVSGIAWWKVLVAVVLGLGAYAVVRWFRRTPAQRIALGAFAAAVLVGAGPSLAFALNLPAVRVKWVAGPSIAVGLALVGLSAWALYLDHRHRTAAETAPVAPPPGLPTTSVTSTVGDIVAHAGASVQVVVQMSGSPAPRPGLPRVSAPPACSPGGVAPGSRSSDGAAQTVPLLDVLVVVAIQEEFQAARAVDEGALEPWQELEPLLWSRRYQTAAGTSIVVGLAQSLDMRGVPTANAAHSVMHKYGPRCLAMCGVCAGRRGKVALGDVIIADTVWAYDGGTVTRNAGDASPVLRPDPRPYTIASDWKAEARALVAERVARIHVGAIATGQSVVRDEGIFDRLAQYDVSTIGIDMEAHAIGEVAYYANLPFLVVKAVMDHGDATKDDDVKATAARASAECLFELLRRHLVPRTPARERISAFATLIDQTLASPRVDARPALQTTDGSDLTASLLAATRDTRTILLVGEGGGGKSTSVADLCHRLAGRGTAAVMVRAGSYRGDLARMLAATLPVEISLDDVATDAPAGTSVVLVVDGCNECSLALRTALATELAQALIRVPSLRLLCTSRDREDVPLGFERIIEVSLPDAHARIEILRAHGAAADTLQIAEAVFLRTPLDLVQAAVAWRSLRPGHHTRYDLRAEYVRRRLAEDNGTCYEILRDFARELTVTASATMPSLDFGRWFDRRARDASAATRAILRHSGLLLESAGETTYAHETYRDYFLAESLLREHDDPGDLATAIDRPRHHSADTLVLEASHDAQRTLRLLSASTRLRAHSLAILEGQHGDVARDVLAQVARGIVRDLDVGLGWRLEGQEKPVLYAEQPSGPLEGALCPAIGLLSLRDPGWRSIVLAALARLESRIEAEANERAREWSQGARTAGTRMYAAAFWSVSRTRAAEILHGVSHHHGLSAPRDSTFVRDVQGTPLGPARALYVAEAIRATAPHNVNSADALSLLLRLIDEGWGRHWGQLRIASMNATRVLAASLTEVDRAVLLERVRSLDSDMVWVNSDLLEVLEMLGDDFDEQIDGAAEGLRDELAQALASPTDVRCRALADAIVGRQLEPLSLISEPATRVIDALADAERARLYAMASLGAESYGFETDLCVSRVPQCHDATTPEDRDLFHEALRRWATPPGVERIDADGRARVFLVANHRLARCGHWEAIAAADTSPEGAWAALAALMVADARGDDDMAAAAWARFDEALRPHAWLPLSLALRAHAGWARPAMFDLVERWPQELSSLLLLLIRERDRWQTPASSAFRDRDALHRFIDALGRCGGPAARATLVDLADDGEVGVDSVAAIREIDRRLAR